MSKPRDPKVLRIIVDTREQKPLTPEFPPTYRGYTIEIERGTLPAGDYSLAGYGGRDGEQFGITIERKADLDEIAGNLCDGRETFMREMQRLALYETAMIVIGQPLADIRCPGCYRTQMTPDSLEASIHSIMERRRVPVIGFGRRDLVARYVLDALVRFLERDREGLLSRVKDSPIVFQTAHQVAQTSLRLGIMEGILQDWMREKRRAEEDDWQGEKEPELAHPENAAESAAIDNP